MRGERFWKKIVVLCLTFWVGTFIAEFFVSKKTPPKETVVVEQRNCVPADKNLKYQFLKEDSIPAEEKSEEQIPAELEEMRKRLEKTDKSLYRPDKDRFEYETLLHKEHCYETKE